MSDATRRTIRTAVAWLLSLAAALPAIVDASGIPASLPWAAGALAVAAAVTRVMALPAVDALLPGWLRKEPPPKDAEGRP
ncbi:hypothetical protein [Streptomyces boncukensis]|uniref:Holin n=1 Tax=Streptomyces boncukensis TaxID=2711219 RepID=A0A6G4WT27_9ACTN|nr:hypothetical protein [Streptomyces boncukensis]NGO67631.1 hypothetical protein [Streptomyces boncukensis]